MCKELRKMNGQRQRFRDRAAQRKDLLWPYAFHNILFPSDLVPVI